MKSQEQVAPQHTVPADFNLALSVFVLVRGVQMIHEPNIKCQKTASVFNPNAKNNDHNRLFRWKKYFSTINILTNL